MWVWEEAVENCASPSEGGPRTLKSWVDRRLGGCSAQLQGNAASQLVVKGVPYSSSLFFYHMVWKIQIYVE